MKATFWITEGKHLPSWVYSDTLFRLTDGYWQRDRGKKIGFSFKEDNIWNMKAGILMKHLKNFGKCQHIDFIYRRQDILKKMIIDFFN